MSDTTATPTTPTKDQPLTQSQTQNLALTQPTESDPPCCTVPPTDPGPTT